MGSKGRQRDKGVEGVSSEGRYPEYCGMCKYNNEKGRINCEVCQWDGSNIKVPDMWIYEKPKGNPDKIPGAKSDVGKLKLSDVPPEIIEAVAKVREFGNRKYSDPENWKRVDPEKFHDAMLRHVLHSWTDWRALDEESGLPAIFHIACNAAFLCAFLMGEGQDA